MLQRISPSTGIKLTLIWYLEHSGLWIKVKKWIKIAGLWIKADTAVTCGSIIREILPPRLIYGGKTARCHPQISFLIAGSLLIAVITGPMRRPCYST